MVVYALHTGCTKYVESGTKRPIDSEVTSTDYYDS